MPVHSFENLVVQAHLVSAMQLSIARRDADLRRRRLAATLIDLGFVDERKFADWAAGVSGTSLISPLDTTAAAALSRRIPRALAREYEVVPVAIDHEELTVAMVNPIDEGCIEVLRSATGLKIRPAVALLGELRRLVTALYPEDDVDPTILPSAGATMAIAGNPDSQIEASSGSQLDRLELQVAGLIRSVESLSERVRAIEETMARVLKR